MSRIGSAPLPGTQVDPLYPDSDGRPMGDTDFHNQAMRWLQDALEDHFENVADVYVARNIVMYYKQGDTKSRRDPDVLVARGVVGKHSRRSFRVWEEGVVPCTLFEIASKDTWRVDLNEKPKLYASLGVKEYFLFDPEGVYLDPVLQGFRTIKGKPVAMRPAADGSLVSKQLGLRMISEDGMLRLFDTRTGEPIPTRAEGREQERHNREQAQQIAEQERLLREQAQQVAEQERLLREQAQERNEALEAELQRLRKQLERGEGNKA